MAGQPDQFQVAPDTTRDRLLAAARQLFAQNGFNGTSIRDITAAADINLGAVTYYFTSKDLLYTHVLQSIVGPLGARIEWATHSDLVPPLEKIERVVRAFFEHFRQNPDMPAFMMRELSSGQPPSGPVAMMQQRVLAAVARVVAEGQARGQIRAGDPALLTFSVIAQPVHLYLARRAIGTLLNLDVNDPATLDRIIEHVTTTVRRSLEIR